MTTTKTPAEILNGAADLIEQTGLGRDYYYQPKSGCYCTAGAIAHVAGWQPVSEPWDEATPDWNEIPVTQAAFAALRAAADLAWHFPGGTTADHGIPLWNDQEDRTAEEVVATLREAAVLAAAA